MHSRALYLAAASLAVAASAAAAEPRDLAELSLEELSNLEVTSVSRKEEPLAEAAAAISVVTNEDLRRSGATTIPEALRLVPGLHVAQITSSAWGVSSRGFSSLNSAKLLVLSDTRSIYTPLFSGVFWYVQDFLLEDLDRVEVIRGPGASLWGANAVNGVINITSRSAKETQGAYFEGGGGTIERAFGAVRYGGQLGEGLYFRVFAKGFDRAAEFSPSGPADDQWKLGHFGFRADWELDGKNTLTVQGDAYTADVGLTQPSIIISGRPNPAGPLVAEMAGGNILARWTHTFSPGSDIQLRAYYDGTHRDDPSFLDNLDTFDVEFQHRFQLPLKQEVTWGLNYRSMDDRNQGKVVFALSPPDSQDNLFSGFAQDQIALFDSLKITLGTKLEHNDFSGFEYQPTARVSWNPGSHTVWAAVSRAVRIPTRLERDLDINVTSPDAPAVEKLLGNRAFASEKLLAWELGYRWQLKKWLFADLAGFVNSYRGLASLELESTFVDPQTGQKVFPLVNENLTDGTAKGVEASLTITPARALRLVADYTWFLLALDPHGKDYNRGYLFAGSTPRNQGGLKSFLDLPAHFQLDAFFRFASSVPASAQLVAGEDTPAYAQLDLRVAWQASRQLELSLVGRNLMQDHHREFPGGTEMERAAYGKLAGRF